MFLFCQNFHASITSESGIFKFLAIELLLNLGLGLFIPNLDMAGHIGGLVGGILTTMAVGIENKTKKQDRINGLICLVILILFLVFILNK